MKKLAAFAFCCLPTLVLANNYDDWYQAELKNAEKITGFKFANYNTSVYKGKKAALNKKDGFVRAFRTRIGDAHQEGVITFAGKYITTSWGCGTQCVSGAMIDKSTGKVYGALSTAAGVIDDENIHPTQTCEMLTDGITGDAEQLFKNNSRLMIVKVTCNAYHNIDTPYESATVIYHVLEWQEKNKKFKWLADKAIKVPTSQLYN